MDKNNESAVPFLFIISATTTMLAMAEFAAEETDNEKIENGARINATQGGFIKPAIL